MENQEFKIKKRKISPEKEIFKKGIKDLAST